MALMRISSIEIKDANIFEILLDHFPDMIQSVDQQGNIVYVNRTAERLLGYTQQELTGMNIRQLYAEEVLPALEKGFSDLKKTGDKSVESLLKAKNGTKIPVEIRSFSIYNDNGEFIRTFSILRDIRQVKELQQSLIHAGRLAAIGELASGVAHDINNPLTVILLSIELMSRQCAKFKTGADAAAVEMLAQITDDVHKASMSIKKLSEHLRNFSRGMMERHEVVDLADSIADAIFMTANKIQVARVDIDNRVSKDQYLVSACPNHMEQVFVNLIGNACDAMANQPPPHQLTLSVSAERRQDVDYWRCDVTDNGPGIPREIADMVFQSFFTTKEKGKGTGLGLSISRGIIKEHKGEIELTSEPGKGATFSVLLPQWSA